MNYREPVRSACQELAAELSGLEMDGGEGEVDLWLSDPGLIIDFNQIAWTTPNGLTRAPKLTEPEIAFYQDDEPSYFPCFSPYAEYIDQHRSSLITEKAVSFVDSTGTESTDDSYLRDRRNTLKDAGIEREQQINVLLPGRIPEELTQKLAVYYLITNGWMVAEDSWFSPRLRFHSFERGPGYGIPDIVAWRSQFTAKLSQRGWLRDGGTLQELGHLSIRESFHDNAQVAGEVEEQTLVGEVKKSDTSIGSAVKQLYERNKSNPGYLKSDCFDEGYGIVALERGRDSNGAGTITFDRSGFQFSKDAISMDYQGNEIESETRAVPDNKQKLLAQLDEFAAQMLLCNVSWGDLRDLIHMDGANRPHRFFTELDYLAPEQILQFCEDKIDRT